jgi:hypothetical protein
MGIAFFSVFAYLATYQVTYGPNGWGITATVFPYAGYAVTVYYLGLASMIAGVVTVFVPERFFLHPRTSLTT